MNSISVVIPVLNESETICALLTHLENKASSQNYIHEIIVVDGGSSDDTITQVTQYAALSKTVSIITSQKGRARQMNTGAIQATGDILYFLHADSYPPQNYDALIVKQVSQEILRDVLK